METYYSKTKKINKNTLTLIVDHRKNITIYLSHPSAKKSENLFESPEDELAYKVQNLLRLKISYHRFPLAKA